MVLWRRRKRFMALSPDAFAIYIRTLDTSYVPQSTSHPQKRYQYAKYPSGNEMASFDDFENIKKFFEIWFAFAQLSGQPVSPVIDFSPPIQIEDIDSGMETGGDSDHPHEKRKINSPCLPSRKKHKPSNLKQNVRARQATETWLAACAEGPDMELCSIDFKSLSEPVQEALEKLAEIDRNDELDKWIEYQCSLRTETEIQQT